jgi:hypothetical protein
MTIKTNSKSDPKGASKPIKKGTQASSSLATIMKMGGVAVGAKAGKTEVVERSTRRAGKRTPEIAKLFKVQTNKPDDGGGGEINNKSELVINSTDDDVTMDGIYVADNEKDNSMASWDTVMEDKAGDGRVINEVTKWQNEILRIEEMIPAATSKERKESLEIQLGTAQMMLKQMLLRLSSADTVGGETTNQSDSDNEDMLESTQGEGIIQQNGSNTQENNNETGLDEDTITNAEGADINVGTTRDQDSNEDMDNLNGEDSLKEGANMSTFNWADVSDDDTVVLDNRDIDDTWKKNWQKERKQW